MSAVCPSCGGQQDFGLLCSDCCAIIETMFAAVPQLVEQLDVAISKQAKVGGSGKAGKGSAHLRAPINFGALAVRDALLVEFALWGDDIDAIRRHPQAAEIAKGIGRAVKDAYRAIDRMADREYLGQCYNELPGGEKCLTELWVRPGAKQAKCSFCGYTHDVPTRREQMMYDAEDMLFTLQEAARIIGAYGSLTISESTIRNYVSKGKLVYHGKVAGLSVIRLGDLLAVITAQAAKPRGRQLRRAS